MGTASYEAGGNHGRARKLDRMGLRRYFYLDEPEKRRKEPLAGDTPTGRSGDWIYAMWSKDLVEQKRDIRAYKRGIRRNRSWWYTFW